MMKTSPKNYKQKPILNAFEEMLEEQKKGSSIYVPLLVSMTVYLLCLRMFCSGDATGLGL